MTGRLRDYLGQGLRVNRPISLSLTPNSLGVYRSIDTQELFFWDGTTWILYIPDQPTSMAAQRDYVERTPWIIRSSAADNNWRSVCWSPELRLFCAVADTGIGNRVMTSPDGIVWTARVSAADNEWVSVCWSPELRLFCAVAVTGVGNRVMTSPDGIVWTARTSAADNAWFCVCWSSKLRLFCAVAASGTGNRVMTSPDGIVWTARTSAADNAWRSVTYAQGLGLFCAVSSSGTGNRVMTSPDGIVWTARTSAADNDWFFVSWAQDIGLFCVVALTGVGNRVMTSPDGIVWTARTSATNNDYLSVTWAPELGRFCSVSRTGIGNRVMTSASSRDIGTLASLLDVDIPLPVNGDVLTFNTPTNTWQRSSQRTFSTSFLTITGNSPTESVAAGRGLLLTGASNLGILRYRLRSFTGDITVTTKVQGIYGRSFNGAGILLRNSVNGQSVMLTHFVLSQSSNVGTYTVEGKLNSSDTSLGGPGLTPVLPLPSESFVWLRMVFTASGASANLQYSADGIHWISFSTQALAGANTIGLTLRAQSADPVSGLFSFYNDGTNQWNFEG
jgi:hypothetical protein